MSKISLGCFKSAEINGDEITLSVQYAPRDVHEVTLERVQLVALIQFAVREKFIEPMVPLSDIDQANINLEEALAAIKRIVNDINPIHLGQVIRSRRRSPPIRLGYGKPVRVPAYFDEGELS